MRPVALWGLMIIGNIWLASGSTAGYALGGALIVMTLFVAMAGV